MWGGSEGQDKLCMWIIVGVLCAPRGPGCVVVKPILRAGNVGLRCANPTYGAVGLLCGPRRAVPKPILRAANVGLRCANPTYGVGSTGMGRSD